MTPPKEVYLIELEDRWIVSLHPFNSKSAKNTYRLDLDWSLVERYGKEDNLP